MLNTTEAQLLKYSHERNAEKIMERGKITRFLGDFINLKMKKYETIDEHINRAEGLKNKCRQLGK